MSSRLMVVIISSLAIFSGCSVGSLDSGKYAQMWIGQNAEDIQIHWGDPSSIRNLEASGGQLLTYHEIDEQAGRDNRSLCEELGIKSGWADLCNSEGEVLRSECLVNVAISKDGRVKEIAIVRDIPGGPFGICNRIIKPRRQA